MTLLTFWWHKWTSPLRLLLLFLLWCQRSCNHLTAHPLEILLLGCRAAAKINCKSTRARGHIRRCGSCCCCLYCLREPRRCSRHCRCCSRRVGRPWMVAIAFVYNCCCCLYCLREPRRCSRHCRCCS